MTRLLIAYDASAAARAAVATATALIPHGKAAVACVAQPATAPADEALVRAGIPDGLPAGELEAIRSRADAYAAMAALEGAQMAAGCGLPAELVPLPGGKAWHALLAEADRRDCDVIVCGTRGEGRLDRVLLGSTASSLLHHATRPLLVVPGPSHLEGPLLAGYDGSPGARAALRFAAAHLDPRRLIVAHAWRSPVRRTARGRALLGTRVAPLHDYAAGMDEVFGELASAVTAEGVEFARGLGLDAEGLTLEAPRPADALLDAAGSEGAAAVLVGAGGDASALVHAAALPVLVVPDLENPTIGR